LRGSRADTQRNGNPWLSARANARANGADLGRTAAGKINKKKPREPYWRKAQ
jgi:hypothetical protein